MLLIEKSIQSDVIHKHFSETFVYHRHCVLNSIMPSNMCDGSIKRKIAVTNSINTLLTFFCIFICKFQFIEDSL